MNDQVIEINISMDSLSAIMVSIPQLLDLLDGIFIRQLRTIWGYTGEAEYIHHTMSVRVRISAPDLLIYGIERKLNEIARNPTDESLYQIESYPQDHRPRTHATMRTASEINAINFTDTYSETAGTSTPLIDMGGSVKEEEDKVQEAVKKKYKPRNRRIVLDVK